ncbi:MAG: IucA/IucC family C-terminal-domain containing protein [Acidimicrobiales bacterium]
MSFLAETGARLGRAAGHLGFGVGPPAGSGWVRLDELVVSGLLDRVAEDLRARQGRGDVAGSYLGSHVAVPFVASTVAALVVDGRCPDPDPSNVSVHLHDAGWFDGVRFLEPRAAVLPDDPAAGQPGTVVVADAAALRQWWAEAITAALCPMLEAVRARLPYARRGLWGSVADRVAGVALTAGRGAGRPGAEGWAVATELLDALAAHAPVRLTRPSPLRVTSPTGREGWFPIRGTCCLYYLTVEGPDPCGDGYCTTCPFTDPDHRQRRLAAWLDEEAEP